jgi:3-hydroxyacyl-CoA dehydrogenase/enoyl-CoA hydratase/3-hydroxybutyryl-CoA epimerase
VRDGVGFYTSRILHPYLTEAAYLLAQGVAVPRIDAALVDWGFSVGPFALLDEMGLDVHHGVARALREAFGERMAPPQSCERVTGSGRLGRRSGRGYYLYRRGKRTRPDPGVYTLLQVRPTCSLPAGEIVQRCVLRMVNEAVLCLSSGILRNARDGDVGAVFGLGFPAFRGGPFRYVDEVGAEEIVRRLRGFEKELGMRFTPAPRLLEMAGEGRAFYAAQPVRPRDG